MRLAATVLTCLLIFTAPMAATFEDCGCSATDGTCSAHNSCDGRGCIAMCPGGGVCRATCSGRAGTLGFEGGDSFTFNMQVSLRQVGDKGDQLATKLSRLTGKQVVYTPYKAGQVMSLDVKKAVLWDVLDLLSASGKIMIGGEDFATLQHIRKVLVSGEKMSVCAHGTTVQNVVAEFESISGMPLKITSGDPNTIVNTTIKDATFEEIIAQLASQSGVEIVIQ